MPYFPPYIDSSGLHMPTYEDRMEALADAYRSIFGTDAELSESVPDYQLLSVFARALDDASALPAMRWTCCFRSTAFAASPARRTRRPAAGS